jgi:hypothetical protein
VDFDNNQKYSLLSKMGYTGPAEGPAMEAFIQSSPGVSAKMGKFSKALQKRVSANVSANVSSGMAAGGQVQKVGYATGGTTQTPGGQITDAIIQNPANLATQAPVALIQPTADTLISPNVGQVTGQTVASTAQAPAASTVAAPKPTAAATVKEDTVTDEVNAATKGVTGAQGTVSAKSQVTAAQDTTSAISGMQAAQGQAYLMQNPVQREIEAGELISGSAVDAAKVDKLMSGIEAAQATPSQKATVQGQLEGLMAQFEGGNTPAWAAGAMRNAQAMLAQRGLGASSLAGQAVIQAAMESALPIAQVDAATFAQFEGQNLSNRQQTALFAAQQRAAFLQMDFDQGFQTRVLNAAKVADVANMNFTAEQNIALENSRAVNTMNLANLDARQGMVMAQAAALVNLDMANLNNRQQAAVQNAQAFLQMDMSNLDNRQQATMFRAQSQVQALFTDQAATNAARQFNASSTNQTNQFFADLSSRVGMFNSEQRNAVNMFNAGEKNVTERFNKQVEAQRQQFNAANSLVIAQANAQWRQTIATTNTEAQNESNRQMAKDMNVMTSKAMDELWQKERDLMDYAFRSWDTNEDRATQLLIADKTVDLAKWEQGQKERQAKSAAWWTWLRSV